MDGQVPILRNATCNERESNHPTMLDRLAGSRKAATHKAKEWFTEHGGHMCHTKAVPGSKPVLGLDREPVIYTNALNIRLNLS